MSSQYSLPAAPASLEAPERTVYLIASGDLRESANQAGWAVQEAVERRVVEAVERRGWTVVRAHEFQPDAGHGFIASQRQGLEVFASIPPDSPLMVVEAVWQYSHHVLHGLRTHRGPILTVANFEGRWPGLVGLLGLNAGLAKMGKAYSTLWSESFDDAWFLDNLEQWLAGEAITHDDSHVQAWSPAAWEDRSAEQELGHALADQLLREKAIIGVFDEGCMGMYNAIIDDELMNPIGIYKERLSQSALWAEMQRVGDDEADAVGAWLTEAGMTFRLGTDEATELTAAQLRWQYKMYVAAVRIADDFGVDAIGIQYQQGLKDICPASDLAEGLLNNVERPPVRSRDGARELFAGRAVPHFNEADEGVAIDSVVTHRIWTAMGMDPATTLHDVRWADRYDDEFVWVFEISGSVPASHLEGGYAGAEGWRQGPVYFPLGGSTLRGVCRAGHIVWSRVYVLPDGLHVDLGVAQARELPREETERRWQATTPEWPIMHVTFPGITRDQFMARHKANHVNVAYATDADAATRALVVKAALFARLGVQVHLCGEVLSGARSSARPVEVGAVGPAR
ncbi:MAG: fucose isomerase [Dermatophilaceae bacterium]